MLKEIAAIHIHAIIYMYFLKLVAGVEIFFHKQHTVCAITYILVCFIDILILFVSLTKTIWLKIYSCLQCLGWQ